MITNKTIYQHAIMRSLKKSGSGQTTGTAQGAIVSFSTNTVKPIVSGVFDIDYSENGVTGMNITRCGKNLFDENYTNISSSIRYKAYQVPNGTYTMSTNTPLSSGAAVLFFFSGNVSGGASTSSNGVSSGISRTITVSDGYLTVGYREYPDTSPEDYNTQIEYGTTPTAYKSFDGDTYLVSFGDTIYGGTFNSVTGILTSMLDSDGTPLETPVMSELTPVEIDTLDGINNIFCDTGDADISYIVNGASKKDKVLSYLPIIYGRKELL